jgi:hypothetical protein
MEFFNDRLLQRGSGDVLSGQQNSPRARDWFDIPTDYPWMRETALVDAGTNNSYGARDLNIYAVLRGMTMQSRNATPSPVTGKNADSLYVPLSVHASWVRLALYADLSASNAAAQAPLNAGTARLKVYANLGGHAEWQYLSSDVGAARPYAYNAQVDGAEAQVASDEG